MLTQVTLTVDLAMLQSLQMGLTALKTAAAKAEASIEQQVQAALDADAAANAPPDTATKEPTPIRSARRD